MPYIEYYISKDDLGKLFLLKEQDEKDDMTGNEYAQYLLKMELDRRHPEPYKHPDEQ